MKQGHFLLLFTVIFLIFVFAARIEQARYDKMIHKNDELERALQTAVNLAAEQIVMNQSESDHTCISLIYITFFESLYASLGIINQPEKQTEIEQYISCITFMKPEGYYLCYSNDLKDESGGTYRQRVWTKLQEYTEKQTNPFDDGSKPTRETPFLRVTYQRIPMQEDRNNTCCGYVEACVEIQRKEQYVVDVPVFVNYTTSVYHRIECLHIGTIGYRTVTDRVSEEDAVTIYGCDPCSYCIQ